MSKGLTEETTGRQPVLEVSGLEKRYPAFHLENVGFALEKGRIMGFIGRNGAGKTTTLKALLSLIHPDGGQIRFFGLNYEGNERQIRQRVGFASGGVNYYPRKKLRDITAVTKRFYDNWDEEAYQHYLAAFHLDEDKRPRELSEGMKVKYNLAAALSHHAELLILDEPTSGLDPVSRDELLEIFLDLKQAGTAILFSTHITSDLDKCADDITYIRDGKIRACSTLTDFLSAYRMLEIPSGVPVPDGALGVARSRSGASVLLKASDAAGLSVRAADLEEIMIHLEKDA